MIFEKENLIFQNPPFFVGFMLTFHGIFIISAGVIDLSISSRCRYDPNQEEFEWMARKM